ncbi:sporulation-specific protein 22 [Teratosphaeriaceae sp. CCFEE 6253]|nr:sporulation-specific protein 22 [Teratosphaeriaceae sp. CCFEE 6253]
MAPLKLVKNDVSEQRLQHVLDCANTVCTLLKDRAVIPENLRAEIDSILKRTLPFVSSIALPAKRSALDSLGCQLWNAATNSLRDAEGQALDASKRREHTRLVVLLRVFGYLLVDAAQHTPARRTKDEDQRVRTFKVAVKACRFCLDVGELDLAMKVMERLAEYATAAEKDIPIVRIVAVAHDAADQREAALKQLTTEYHLLRLTHAWKSDRFDVADLSFTKIDQRELAGCASLTEKAADVFHEAAQSLVVKKVWDSAIKWCERAIDSLDNCGVEELSYDAPELRLAITATFVEALLTIGTAEAREHALRLVEQLEMAYGMTNRIAVSLMRLQILTGAPKLDLTEVNGVITQMIKQAVLTDKSFKTIMQTIHKVKRVSLQSAIAGLSGLISLRLLPDILPEDATDSQSLIRLEKAIVTYVLFVISSEELPQDIALADIGQTLETFSHQTKRTLSAKATHAAQTLIWKKTAALGGDLVDDWCRLLRHAAFESAGHMNKARIGRKAVVAALDRDNTDAARQAFFEMPAAGRDESITRYLMFRVALRDSDYELATECLTIVTKHADKDATYLYACVLEAQQSKMRHVAVAALRALSEKLPPGAHLPSLLRCTARLLIGELEARAQEIDRPMEDVVVLFERAAKNTAALRQGTDEQWRSEVHWWSKNAYNLALKWCADIHPEYLIRLLNVCGHFLDCYQPADGPMHQDDVSQRRLLCNFLSASALIVLGRSYEEGSTATLGFYSRARGQIASFIRHSTQWQAPTGKDRATEAQQRELSARKFELLKFDLECILKLKQWDQLDKVVAAFLACEDADRWDSLADLVIVVHDHARHQEVPSALTKRVPELLQQCINQTWRKDKDVKKMSRWLRLAFSVNMADGDPDFALKIVEQAAGVARRGYDGHTEVYPLDELCWLATTAFNKAVDSMAGGDVEGPEPWIAAALELARYADDNGSLHGNLTRVRDSAAERVRNASGRGTAPTR